MVSTLIFWLFLAFLFGTTMAILMLGYSSVEKHREQEARQHAVDEARALSMATAVPRFFLKDGESRDYPNAPIVNDAMLADLENYVRAEQAAVARFVNEPSIEHLYGNSGGSTHVN